MKFRMILHWNKQEFAGISKLSECRQQLCDDFCCKVVSNSADPDYVYASSTHVVLTSILIQLHSCIRRFCIKQSINLSTIVKSII